MPASLGSEQRRVTLLLCDSGGRLLGQTDPFVVEPQWWPETGEILDHVHTMLGLHAVVLRLLTTTTPSPAGGEVAYLAEVRSGSTSRLAPPDPDLAALALASAPERLWWARPGGFDYLPEWVDVALETQGLRRTGPLRQRKTWNLSVVVTAPTDHGEVWFKATPPFLADEGGVIRRVAHVDRTLPPRVLAHDPAHRAVLMEDVPGEDQWGVCDDAVIAAMLARWVAVQAALADDVEHAMALGAPDRRTPQLLREVGRLLGRPEVRASLAATDLARVDELVGALPERLAVLDGCGLPDTLLHGDLHPGNWRRTGDRLALLDWGDVAVGNPAGDMRAFLERLPDDGFRDSVARMWAREWQRYAPGSDPLRALRVVAPVAELAAAATYQRFLDHIEPSERAYHAADPADRLRRAVLAARQEAPADG